MSVVTDPEVSKADLSPDGMALQQVQIRPWNLNDSDFVMDGSQPLDPRKTIFVGGVPRPLRAGEPPFRFCSMNTLHLGCYCLDSFQFVIRFRNVSFQSTNSEGIFLGEVVDISSGFIQEIPGERDVKGPCSMMVVARGT